MVAVVVEHVIFAAGVFLGHLLYDLGESIVHEGDLAEVYLFVEGVVGSLGLHLEDAGVLGVGGADAVAVLDVAMVRGGCTRFRCRCGRRLIQGIVGIY